MVCIIVNFYYYNNNNNNNNNNKEIIRIKTIRKEIISLFLAQEVNNLETSPVTLFHVFLTFVLAICSLLRYLKCILSACNGYNKLPK